MNQVEISLETLSTAYAAHGVSEQDFERFALQYVINKTLKRLGTIACTQQLLYCMDQVLEHGPLTEMTFSREVH